MTKNVEDKPVGDRRGSQRLRKAIGATLGGETLVDPSKLTEAERAQFAEMLAVTTEHVADWQGEPETPPASNSPMDEIMNVEL